MSEAKAIDDAGFTPWNDDTEERQMITTAAAKGHVIPKTPLPLHLFNVTANGKMTPSCHPPSHF
jgi:hypothetical protein